MLELESAESLHFVMETVRQTRARLPSCIPLIGFAGAPFTLASYVIEGGGQPQLRAHQVADVPRPRGVARLMRRLARAVTPYLNAQIAAGAQCVQLFDSLGRAAWRPTTTGATCCRTCSRSSRAIAPGVPVINFATGNPGLLPLLAEAGGDVIGVDWRDPAGRRAGRPWATTGRCRATSIPRRAGRPRRNPRPHARSFNRLPAPGHIFNLGHGVLPQTPVDHAIALVDIVHEMGSKNASH